MASSLDDVLRRARQEILNFQKAGGKNNDPGHPAEQWARELWKWRDTFPGTPDAATATTEAVRLLVYADRFTEVEARVDGIRPGDPAWPTLAACVVRFGFAAGELHLLFRQAGIRAEQCISLHRW